MNYMVLASNKVEVVYALETEQRIFEQGINQHSTVSEVIEQCGILEHYPEIKLEHCEVGIFSNKVRLESVVKAGDRIEIYRPLVLCPKERRRQKALNNPR